MAEIIVQAGYMSGDMFGVAAALKLQPDLYVLIVHDDKDVSNANKMYELCADRPARRAGADGHGGRPRQKCRDDQHPRQAVEGRQQ